MDCIIKRYKLHVLVHDLTIYQCISWTVGALHFHVLSMNLEQPSQGLSCLPWKAQKFIQRSHKLLKEFAHSCKLEGWQFLTNKYFVVQLLKITIFILGTFGVFPADWESGLRCPQPVNPPVLLPLLCMYPHPCPCSKLAPAVFRVSYLAIPEQLSGTSFCWPSAQHLHMFFLVTCDLGALCSVCKKDQDIN